MYRQFVGKLKIESKLNHVAKGDANSPLWRDANMIGKKIAKEKHIYMR